MKTALITGGTDGIGKGFAIALAKDGWQVHIVGRSAEKGEHVMSELASANPEGKHRVFLYDLGNIQDNIIFLEKYTKEQASLDLLFLNANIRPGKQFVNAEHGYSQLISIGYFSRYLYTVMLDPLLAKTEGARVLHNTEMRIALKINPDKWKDTKVGGVRTLYNAYMADAYFTQYIVRHNLTTVAHEGIAPGSVDTNREGETSGMLKVLTRFLGAISSDEIGNILVQHIKETTSQQVKGAFYERRKYYRPAKGFDNEEIAKKLVTLAEVITGVEFKLGNG